MAQIILDYGSGNTCQNDPRQIEDMLEAIYAADTGKHEVIIKWQLFKNAPPNVPLTHESFEHAYNYAKLLGYKTTSSVFDRESLDYLMRFDIPFVKIANRADLYQLAWGLDVPVYVSYPGAHVNLKGCQMLACVSSYPATVQQYEDCFNGAELDAVSDHTVGWGLFNRHNCSIIEKHFVHVRREGNPDAGPFSVTPDQLREVL
jgi:sialic acid synthase SpsE